MSRQYSFAGRPQTAKRQSWRKLDFTADGFLIDATPAPGRTYTRDTWPPRGRGRGESLTSPRRIHAKLRTIEVIHLRMDGYTWAEIARMLGFKDGSGPYRAMKRTIDRIDWDTQRRKEQEKNGNRH